jgi:hypothetical protein
MRAMPSLRIIHYRDNLIPKVLFWPVVLLFMIGITLYVLWVGPPERGTAECLAQSEAATAFARPQPGPLIAAYGDSGIGTPR